MPIVFDAYFYERAGATLAIIAFIMDEAGVYQQISFLCEGCFAEIHGWCKTVRSSDTDEVFKIIAHFHCRGKTGLRKHPRSQLEMMHASNGTVDGLDHKQRYIRMKMACRNMECEDETELFHYMTQLRETGLGPPAIVLPDDLYEYALV